jgi:flagellin
VGKEVQSIFKEENMGLRINTNVASINAQRNLFNNTIELTKSMERLSSGLRINRAGDDAAGLAISEGLRSDIRALQQASRNAADGVSMVQTAEGALDEVSNILLRLRELAEQAATETLGSAERDYLDAEYQDLLEEITRISDTTEFNGSMLLDGTAGSLDIQVGIGTAASSQVTIGLGTNMDATTLGLTQAISGTDGANALTAIGQIESAQTTIASTRGDLGAAQNRLETSIRSIGNQVENLSAANSRIRDVDIAAETANLTSRQILQQAGISVLGQANLMPQMAVLLLQQ